MIDLLIEVRGTNTWVTATRDDQENGDSEEDAAVLQYLDEKGESHELNLWLPQHGSVPVEIQGRIAGAVLIQGNHRTAGKVVAGGAACLAGDTLIRLGDGSSVLRVSQLRKGDRVLGGGTVVCVVSSFVYNAPVCKVSDCVLTPYHPVQRQQDQDWEFPCEVKDAGPTLLTGRMFNLVLDCGHTLTTNEGLRVVTLGHGIQNDPVASHPFFGTERVVRDLERIKGWEQGNVLVWQVLRCGESGMVCGFR